jgi:hypothetical protein
MRAGREAKGKFHPPWPPEEDAEAQGADDIVFLIVVGNLSVGVVASRSESL